jgi:hypothetical protein
MDDVIYGRKPKVKEILKWPNVVEGKRVEAAFRGVLKHEEVVKMVG